MTPGKKGTIWATQ